MIYSALSDRALSERLALGLGWRREYHKQYGGEIFNDYLWFALDGGRNVEPPNLVSWEGMGLVAEGMLENHSLELHLDYSIDGAYAEFSRLPAKGVFAANEARPPRAVAIAALTALDGEGCE